MSDIGDAGGGYIPPHPLATRKPTSPPWVQRSSGELREVILGLLGDASRSEPEGGLVDA